jgi:acetyltransferase-like isoleucine patch superfamily enzyme
MTNFIHELAVVEDRAKIGEGSKIWHWAHVRKDAEVGSNCTIGKSVFIDAGVRIGDNCKIQNNASIYSGVSIGSGVFIGPHVCFTNDKLPRAVFPDGAPRGPQDWFKNETTVCDGVSIGANTTIICGVTLGKWCMLGAGSVVTKSVPPHALILGNPGRIAGIVSASGEIISKQYEPGQYSSTSGETIVIKQDWFVNL